MYGGFLSISLPQLLAGQGVAEADIAAITALTFTPGFWSFLFSPVLDVRFSRRSYATVTAALSGIALAIAILYQRDRTVLEFSLVFGFFTVNLSQGALGGWLCSVTDRKQHGALSAWVTVGNIAGGGFMVLAGAELIRGLPMPYAALAAGGLIVLPTAVFPFIPAAGPDRRLAAESFRRFFGEVLALLRRREVLVAILLFAAPAGTFALTNLLAGVGADFHASTRTVSAIGGAGVIAAGIFGSLLYPTLTRFLPLRPLYLAIGITGGLFTLSLLPMPLNPASFALALIGQNVFQALAFAGSAAIAFEIIGHDNPLAATTYTLTIAAVNVPITYMQIIDGRAYSHGGVAGSYLMDAGVSISTCLLLAGLLRLLRARLDGVAYGGGRA